MITYTVVATHEGALEVWDGRSRVEPDRPEKSTMLLPIESSSQFEVGDIVDIVVVLRERPAKKAERTA